MKDHYNDFVSHLSTEGIQWVYYFKKPKPNNQISGSLLSTDDVKKDQQKKEKNLNKFSEWFPEIGPIFLVADIKHFYNDPKNLKNLDDLSLRSFLKSCYLVYPTDSVSIKIFNQKEELVVSINNKKIKEISIFSEEIANLQKYDCVYIRLVLHVNETNEERLFHESKSFIQSSELFLQDLLKKDKLDKLINQLKDKSPDLYNQRLSLFNNDFNKIYVLDSFLIFKNVEYYIRFLEFINLSKYSNDFLKELDKNFKFDFQISHKLQYRLKYKYIYQGEEV